MNLTGRGPGRDKGGVQSGRISQNFSRIFQSDKVGGRTATWSSPDYVLAPHRGDWHWACDRYREWFDKTFKTPEVPAWAKDCDVWGGGDSDAFKDLGFDAILRAAKRLQKNRVPLQDIYSAMLDGQYQACGDQHYPCPLWGSADQFTEVNRRVHELGVRTMYYFNWRTWTPS